MSSSLYPWVDRDLLKTPEFYMFSPFRGLDFLKEYFLLRKSVAAKLEKRYLGKLKTGEMTEGLANFRGIVRDIDNDLDAEIQDIHRQLPVPAKAAPFQVNELEPMRSVPSQDVFLSLLVMLNPSVVRSPATVKRWVDGLVKSFEVTKKILSTYTPQVRRADDQAAPLLNYALLGEVVLRYYELTGNLKMLNAALKLNDVLCSVESSLDDDVELLATVQSIRHEIRCVRLLADKKEVLQ